MSCESSLGSGKEKRKRRRSWRKFHDISRALLIAAPIHFHFHSHHHHHRRRRPFHHRQSGKLTWKLWEFVFRHPWIDSNVISKPRYVQLSSVQCCVALCSVVVVVAQCIAYNLCACYCSCCCWLWPQGWFLLQLTYNRQQIRIIRTVVRHKVAAKLLQLKDNSDNWLKRITK